MNQTINQSEQWKHLSLIRFKDLINWSVSYLSQSQISFSQQYPFVRIGDFLTRNRTVIHIENGKVYNRVTVKLYGGGVMLRDTAKGEEIGTKRQFLLKKGQFLFSRIDARNGAFGIATDQVDNAIVTNDFPVYDVDKSVISPTYFSLLTTTNHFFSFCQSFSSGTTNRQRMDEDTFLNFRIPLPPLEIQEQLVTDYYNRIAHAEAFKARAKELEHKIESYLFHELGIEIRSAEIRRGLQFIRFKELSRWSIEFLYQKEGFEKIYTTRYPTMKLKQLGKGLSGGTPSKQVSDFWNGDIPWVSPKDMKVELISNTEDYITEAAIKASSAPLIEPNSLLFVVRSGILQHTVPVAINLIPVSINQDLRAFKIADKRIDLQYLFIFFRYAQKLLLKLVKSSTTVQSIDSERLENFEIPLPPLSVQEKLVSNINSLKAEINELRTNAKKLLAEAKNKFEVEVFEL